ncbi:hypothetical protein [Streptomyces sp. NPDC058701]|uniref:hypothetical protein n=1 Tax=Streptomyces sp. NPDC058701 TaxID=3346608 RepID=UPI0036680306
MIPTAADVLTRSARPHALHPLPPICGVLGPALIWDVRPVAWAADEARVQLEGVLRLWRPDPDVLRRAVPLAGVLVRAAIALGATPLRLHLARRAGRLLLAVTYGPGVHDGARTSYEDEARVWCDELDHVGPSAREPSAALIATLSWGEGPLHDGVGT